MQLSLKLREFLSGKKIQDYIKVNDFTAVYEEYTSPWALTAFLFDCEVDPFKYMGEIPKAAFLSAHWITDYVVPKNIKIIDDDAFYDCEKLSTIILSEGLIDIGSNTFGHCKSLTEITIPDTVINIDVSAFLGCSSLSKVTLGKGLIRIHGGAFQQCGVTEIILPHGVQYIDYSAFSGCEQLTHIKIPVTVRALKNKILQSCINLTDITFDGTVQQWANLRKDNGWNKDTGNYIVHCIDGKVTK